MSTLAMGSPEMPVRLLLMLDSRSPAGAHSHSGGMESAVAAGWIETPGDVEDFCRGRLATSARVSAAFAAMACRAWLATETGNGESPHTESGSGPTWWAELDAELSARIPSEAARSASRLLGSGLRRLLLATAPEQALTLKQRWSSIAPVAPHHPLVLGAAAALVGGSPRTAARAAALSACTGPASAAVRLLGLDPYAVHAVTARLAGEIEQVGDAASALVARLDAAEFSGLPAHSALALDLLPDVHARMEVRLFAS